MQEMLGNILRIYWILAFLFEELIWCNFIFFMADIDECKEKSVCGTVARCENMLGMFDCICPQGYRYVEETKGCPG